MSNDQYLLWWMAAFAATQIIEAPIYQRFCVDGRWWAALQPSAITHPLLWFVLTPLWHQVRWPLADVLGRGSPETLENPAIWLMEIGIVIFEGWWLRRLGGTNPWRWALIGNAASYGFGELLYSVLDMN
ncbi:MAG: hypothetical protein HY902_10675 [Deltaproteobacteria bacterium]|nr:hypothetical protein [Deltaproteobacteria bacterium]